MKYIRKVVWFELPDTFTISDVVDKIKEMHNIEIDSMLVNTYLSKMDKAGLILKQGHNWQKNGHIGPENLIPDSDFVPHPMLDVFREY